MTTFTESGMTFSFNEDEFYWIEKSSTISSIDSCKVCECIVFHNNRITLIEAKQSSPRPENQAKLMGFIEEIALKFSDSFSFYHAVHLQRHKDELLPTKLKKLSLCKSNFSFYLIIRGHRIEWLPPLQDLLRKRMKKMLKIWGVDDSNVKVINDDFARKRGLIAKGKELVIS